MGASRPQTPRCFLVLDYLFSSTGNCSSMLNLRVDYPTISVILGHLWNNAIKYVHPNSTLDINFHSNGKHLVTKIKMFSLKIENEEIDDIYKEGYSGKWAKMISKEGHGIGMFYITLIPQHYSLTLFISA